VEASKRRIEINRAFWLINPICFREGEHGQEGLRDLQLEPAGMAEQLL